MKRKITIMTLFVVIVALLAAPMLVPEAQAAPNMGEMEFLFEGLPVDSNVNPIRLNAGEEVEVRVFITNTSPVNWTVTLNARDSPNITYVGEPVTLFVEAAGGEKSVREHDMKFSTDKFTREGAGDSEITLHIMDGGPGYTVTDLIHFDISSNLSASGNFNKIMGVVPNVLPEPFDSPTASAIFTLVYGS